MRRSIACLLAVVSLGSLSLLAPACESSTSSNAGPDGGVAIGDGSASSVDCPTPTAGPTRHSGDVKDGEVWTAAGSPHIVEYDVNVRDGATLTIEPFRPTNTFEGVTGCVQTTPSHPTACPDPQPICDGM